jgi:tetratricopeptide (TPR) repeat protein
VLWAKADGGDTLKADLAALAFRLNLPEKDETDRDKAVAAVKRWLAEQSGWLLILDNADDLTLVREFLPNTPKGRIILTTRTPATGAIATNVGVLEMEEPEGALFLLRRAKILAEDATLESASEEDRQKAVEITKEVDGLPLALDQAGAFIEETPSSPAEYLNLYRTQGAYLRSQRGELASDHPESVAITFSLSFDKVAAASPTAADLLRACAFLAPDLIPEEIFTEGGTDLGDLLSATVNNSLVLINAVKEVRRYSLLRRDPDAHTLSVHRVVQDVLKDTMDESTQREWAERIVKAVSHVLPDFDETDYTDWPVFERLLTQAQACAALIEHWKLKLPEAAQLLNHAARYMHDRGRLTEVEPYYLEALAIRRDLFGQEHLDVAASFYNLAWLRFDQGKYAESETLYLKALDIRTSILGINNTTAADCLSGLGSVKSAQGKFAEAKNYFHQSIDIQEKANYSNTSNMANGLGGLADVLCDQGRYQESEALLLRALEIKKTIYGVEHIEVAGTLSQLGYLFFKKKDYAKAEHFTSSSIRILERVYGVNYPLLSADLDCLARICIYRKKFSEAEALLNRGLEIAVNSYGRENDRVSVVLNTLGRLYREKGELNKAEELYRQSLDIDEKTLGAEHPHTAIGLTNIAAIKVRQREFHQAEQLLRRAIAIGKKTLPPEHPDLLNRQEIYAELLRSMNRKGEAQKLADYVRKMRGKQGRKGRKR